MDDPTRAGWPPPSRFFFCLFSEPSRIQDLHRLEVSAEKRMAALEVENAELKSRLQENDLDLQMIKKRIGLK